MRRGAATIPPESRLSSRLLGRSPATAVSPLFFFSSRRRHTRSKRDWSSDVCSSDLTPEENERALLLGAQRSLALGWCEIGRASCRERVEISVGAVSVKKKRQIA